MSTVQFYGDNSSIKIPSYKMISVSVKLVRRVREEETEVDSILVFSIPLWFNLFKKLKKYY